MNAPYIYIHMNKRLKLISTLIPAGVGFADVGTDHGYLPVYMAKSGYNGNIIASDLRPDPLSCAIAAAQEAHVEDTISFRLCDGLDGIAPDALDTIVIAGMGGDTICGILDRAEWCMDARFLLILQPMTKAEILRYWLTNNGFAITQEHLVRDAGEIYQLITTRFGGETALCDAELFTGCYPLVRNRPLFQEHLDEQIRRFEKAIAGMTKARRIIGRRTLNEEILRELYKMREDMQK